MANEDYAQELAEARSGSDYWKGGDDPADADSGGSDDSSDSGGSSSGGGGSSSGGSSSDGGGSASDPTGIAPRSSANQDDETDNTPEPTESQERAFDGSGGGSSSSGTDGSDNKVDDPSDWMGDDPRTDSDESSLSDRGGSSGDDSSSDESDKTPEPTQNQKQMLDGSTGSTAGSGSDRRQANTTARTNPDQAPESERDAPQNDSTEGIEATKTGELEDVGTGRIKERAQQLEQEVVGKQIGELSSGLKLSGAELREEDVQVTRRGDRLVAELSPVGRERVQNISERQQVEAAEKQVESALGTEFTDDDVTINEDGSVDFSQDVRNEAVEQAIAESNPGVRESDVSFQNGEPQVDRDREETDPATRVEQQTGLEEGQDFTIEEGSDGNLTVNVTDRGAQELRGRREIEDGDALTGAVEKVERVTGVDFPGNTSEAGQARVKRSESESGELFGDRGRVEEALRLVSTSYDRAVKSVADPAGAALAANPLVDIADPAPDTIGADPFENRERPQPVEDPVRGALEANPLVDIADPEPDTIDSESFENSTTAQMFENSTTPQTTEERNTANLFSGAGQGFGSIFNIASYGTTAIEAREFQNAAREASDEGTDEYLEFLETATQAGAARAADTTTQARDSPYELAGTAAGSSVGASAALRAGRALGGARGSTAVGAVVDPAETLLRGIRTTRGGMDTSRSDLGSGGTGALYDADALDEAMGTSRPSRRSRIRGKVQRSELVQSIQAELNKFRTDESGQVGRGRQRRDNSDSGSSPDDDLFGSPADRDPTRPDDAGGTFEDVRQDALTQMQDYLGDQRRAEAQSSDVGGTYDPESSAGQTRPASEQTTRGANRRRERAEQPQARVDDSADIGGSESNALTLTRTGGAFGFAGALIAAEEQRLEAAQRRNVLSGQRSRGAEGLRIGPETGQGVGNEPDTRAPQDIETLLGVFDASAARTDSATDLDQEQRTTPWTDVRAQAEASPNQPSGPELTPGRGYPRDPFTPTKTPLPDDDEPSELSVFGRRETDQPTGPGSAGDTGVEPGWYNEFVAAFAGTSRDAAPGIEDQAEAELADFGTLAVESQDTEEFQAAAAFLSGEGTAVEEFFGGDDGLL